LTRADVEDSARGSSEVAVKLACDQLLPYDVAYPPEAIQPQRAATGERPIHFGHPT
jgi:hypothetical protein